MRLEAGGTVISGKVAMHPFIQVFMFVWFGFAFIGGFAMLVTTVNSLRFSSGGQRQNAWMGIVIPLLMPVFGFGLVRFGRYLARDETRFMKDFLIETLNAQTQD